MKGKHHIVIESSNLKYEFDIKRNITVIQGESATGKTTLIDLLNEYSRNKNASGIRLQSDVPCSVYVGNNDNWKYELQGMSGSIVFIDEDYQFVFTPEFAEYLFTADNYFVFITRKSLKNLPYSIDEIYGIRTSGKYHFPEQIYHEFYPIYKDDFATENKAPKVMVLVEDKEAGYQFFSNVVKKNTVVSAEGNSKVFPKLLEVSSDNQVLVIADGSAFGPYIANVVKYIEGKDHIALYFPESFEWLLLKSGVLGIKRIDEILEHPEEYVDSRDYASWERFFTALLRDETKDLKYMQYNKSELSEYFCSEKCVNAVLDVVPKEIRKYLE